MGCRSGAGFRMHGITSLQIPKAEHLWILSQVYISQRNVQHGGRYMAENWSTATIFCFPKDVYVWNESLVWAWYKKSLGLSTEILVGLLTCSGNGSNTACNLHPIAMWYLCIFSCWQQTCTHCTVVHNTGASSTKRKKGFSGCCWTKNGKTLNRNCMATF